MDRTSIGWTVAICLLYVWASGDTGVASAEKCTGDYAVHSCFGGNGKRSDPNAFSAPGPRPNGKLLQLLAKTLKEMRNKREEASGWDYPPRRTDDVQSLDAFNALHEAYVEEEQEQEELAEQEAAAQEAVSDELNQQYANPDLGYDSSYRLQDSTGGVLSQIFAALRRKLEGTRTRFQE